MCQPGDAHLALLLVRRLDPQRVAHLRPKHRQRRPLDEQLMLGRRPIAALRPDFVDAHTVIVGYGKQPEAEPLARLGLDAQAQVLPALRLLHSLHSPHRPDKVLVERLERAESAAGRNSGGVTLRHLVGEYLLRADDSAGSKQSHGDG